MMYRVLAFLFCLLPGLAFGQFVWPEEGYNDPEPGLYEEDPFIVKYRREFFAVFRGDVERFETAFAEIEQMVEEDPKDARAVVWLGNGLTVKAGLATLSGDKDRIAELLAESNKHLDRAVELSPDDPNIYMMRAATLYVQGMYLPDDLLPRHTWTRLRDDCLRFIEFLGDRMERVSIHVRGETYGELGIAYVNLGEEEKAIEAFEKVIELCPDTKYEERARREIAQLQAGD
jgi:tetratricopeptide (TPR) repeat protein